MFRAVNFFLQGRWWKQSRYFVLTVAMCSAIALSHLFWPMALIAAPPGALQQAGQLNRQGQQALIAGDAEAALAYWQRAEDQYRFADDDLGIWGSQLNQAKAMQTLGFYLRAQDLLTQLSAALDLQPASLLKINVLLSQGNGLRLLGELPASVQVLNQGLAMAQQLGDATHQQAAELSLGNTLFALSDWPAAMVAYARAQTLDGPLLQTAQLREIQTLSALGREAEMTMQVQNFVRALEMSVDDIKGTESNRLYLVLDLAQWLLQQSANGAVATPELTALPPSLLQGAIQQAERLGDRRAEAYGLGYLGRWYEQQQDWTAAQQFTQRALALSQQLDADQLLYQWQWQQGRILRSQGQKVDAIAYYSSAVDTLQTLRQELVAITRDVQFSFRDQIEPIYRELVSLLLSPESLAKDEQKALEQARQVIENLQLTTLNNFFREPCIESIPQALETIDPSAAVIYPIILEDQLAVIVSIQGQPLIYTHTPISQPEVESGIQEMLDAMRVTAFRTEQLAATQKLYQWLIKPTEKTLQKNNIKTLAFVLDGALRDVPMAVLHNGTRYLMESYAIALSPGLQLLQVTASQAPLSEAQVLIGGLVTGRLNQPPLLGVQTEVDHVEQLLNTETLLDEAFTREALRQQSRKNNFDIVHLATHAQFGATDAETFIETWDGTLEINQLRQLLQQQDTQGLPLALLILSACDTAQGNNKAVLGMAGLAVRSGAQSTLATLWSVNDRATATFVQAFYDALIQQGLSKSEAVQFAQQQLRQTPAFQNPYYWAPFVLVGDWT